MKTYRLLLAISFLARFIPLIAVLFLDVSITVMIFFYYFETLALIFFTEASLVKLVDSKTPGFTSPLRSWFVFSFLVGIQTLFLISTMAGRDPNMSIYIDSFFSPDGDAFRHFLLVLFGIFVGQGLTAVFSWLNPTTRLEHFLDLHSQLTFRVFFGQTVTLGGGLLAVNFSLTGQSFLLTFTLLVILLQFILDLWSDHRAAKISTSKLA